MDLLFIPWIFLMAKAISRLSSFSSNSIRTISYGNRSWNKRLILAPPESSRVLTAAEPLPSIARSKSCWRVCMLLIIKISYDFQNGDFHEIASMYENEMSYCSIALVLMEGSSGRKYLYCSTSFSSDKICFWSRSRSPGRVSRMWLVNCWFRTFCK